MELITNKIIEERPKLSKQSIKTYTSILKNLYLKVFKTDDYDIDKFDETSKILEHLNSLEPNKRKTILSALVILTDKKEYRDQMLKDIQSYNDVQHTQEKTDKQNDSWVDGTEIKSILKKLETDAKYIYSKSDVTSSDLQTVQNYIILCLLGGVYIPPRRSKDYVDFKIKNIDKEKDNYLQGTKLIFNSYKTAKTYGQQELDIPVKLRKILKRWLSINPTDYLLFDIKHHKLSNVQLTQRLNRLFDHKKVSSNALRHTYLSEKYQSTIKANDDMAKDMAKMGSSTIQEKIYIKKL